MSVNNPVQQVRRFMRNYIAFMDHSVMIWDILAMVNGVFVVSHSGLTESVAQKVGVILTVLFVEPQSCVVGQGTAQTVTREYDIGFWMGVHHIDYGYFETVEVESGVGSHEASVNCASFTFETGVGHGNDYEVDEGAFNVDGSSEYYCDEVELGVKTNNGEQPHGLDYIVELKLRVAAGAGDIEDFGGEVSCG